jgi:hypothetical protein
VSAAARKKTVKHTAAVVITGAVLPYAHPVTVIPEASKHGHWITAHKTARTSKKHVGNGTEFMYSLKVREAAGRYTFRVVTAASSTNTAGTSSTAKVKVT